MLRVELISQRLRRELRLPAGPDPHHWGNTAAAAARALDKQKFWRQGPACVGDALNCPPVFHPGFLLRDRHNPLDIAKSLSEIAVANNSGGTSRTRRRGRRKSWSPNSITPSGTA